LDFSGGFARLRYQLCARAGWRRDRTLSRVRSLRTTPFMRPRVALIKGSVPYTLCRIEDDASLTPVSEHEDIVAAVVAGKHQVEVEDFDFSYGVYANGRRVICFAEGRIGYREWARRNGRLGDIHALDDRYDHDIDELMV
jgi:hypothetical protein